MNLELLFSRLLSNIPNPEIELEHLDEYTLLVAVMLSAKTTDKAVNLVTAGLFARAKTPSEMISLGEDKIKEIIKSIGLYRTKAKNLVALSKNIIDRYDGKVPDRLERLTTLPGIGFKTAKVVLACAFNKPYIAVDTHVFRLAHRLGLADGRTPDAVSDQLESIIPKHLAVKTNLLLVLHGRYVCKAKVPNCNKCCISDLCPHNLQRL
ncbi:MAG: endonuclease III [Holosporales bacterium]|nr:endonuclease III [Holosporales bacterium]